MIGLLTTRTEENPKQIFDRKDKHEQFINSVKGIKVQIERREEHLYEQCVLDDDWLEFVKPLVDPVPNGIILASPVYFSDVNAEMRAFMERFTSLMKPFWFNHLPFKTPDVL
jgi:multimeric flavodoxin WrbA